MIKIARLKRFKRCGLAVPNYIRLSFYIFPIGDPSFKTELTDIDVDIIKNIDINDIGGLVDMVEYVDEGDLYSLMVEGAIKGRATGADVGIYNYQQIQPKKDSGIDLSKFVGEQFINLIGGDDELTPYSNSELFNNCILAEPDSKGVEYSKIIKTFKGYLQVKPEGFSFIRNCDFGSDISIVYVPQDYIQKYQLRNGDELVCTCKEDKGFMILTSLFAINKISCHEWNNSRPWFNNLKSNKLEILKSNGDIMLPIINKFGLYKGDNMFLYLNKSSQKELVLPKLVKELEDMFDYIIYLNPKYSPIPMIDNSYKTIKFCAPINAILKHQQNIILLGANYAKRLVELGNRVAVVVDDADMIMEIENEADLPISKTVYSCAINADSGYSNSFTAVSLKHGSFKTIKLNKILKSAETIGVVFDNNEIDTFNSYRV